MSKNGKSMHVTISLTLNEDVSWEWSQPKVEKTLVLHLPADFFSGTALAKYVDEQIKVMEKDFPFVANEYNEKKLREEAEKAKEQGA